MVSILIEAAAWKAISFEAVAAEAIAKTLVRVKLPEAATEISLLACDDARITRLNADFRDRERSTNVLSWPAADLSPEIEGDGPVLPKPDGEGVYELGDIAIAFETCAREADELQIPLESHTAHLIVHGTLHLLGYDHIRDRDATVMQALEIEILGKMGIDDPYRN
ncbi:MAG: rRNA maturation RNase YbeY [Paracoccaceae bacterium]|nr:rRNA maturation RNase YbeY [Paracoccaceae bacterium]